MFTRILHFISLLAALTCVSCVLSGPLYSQGAPDLAKSAMFLPQTKEGNLINNSTYLLGPIDGLGRGRAVAFPNGEKGIAVTPGPHRIGVVLIHGSPESKNGFMTAETEIPLTVKAGVVYEPAGSVVGRQRVDLWIRERGNGKKVSKVVSIAPKNHAPYAPPLILPAS
jgi:hypothetical protein